MTRKQFWFRLAGVAVPVAAVRADSETPADESCRDRHNWINGPFFISAARTLEEPRQRPPSGLVSVEHCTRCGAIRLPAAYRTFTGENMGEHD